MWKLVLVHLEVVLVLAQDRRTICAKCTSVMEIILGTTVVLQGVVSHVEARVGPFGGSVSLCAR